MVVVLLEDVQAEGGIIPTGSVWLDAPDDTASELIRVGAARAATSEEAALALQAKAEADAKASEEATEQEADAKPKKPAKSDKKKPEAKPEAKPEEAPEQSAEPDQVAEHAPV